MIHSARINEEIERVIQSLMEYHPQKIILFGSAARGDYHEGSDLDLLIIKDTDQRFVERISDVLAYINSTMPVEPLVYTTEEFEKMKLERNPFIMTALQEGRVLYEQ